MPITLIGSNLNTFGNQGQFETDSSTWGFGSGDFLITRSNVQASAGLYSARGRALNEDVGIIEIVPGNTAGLDITKTYIAKAKIYMPGGPLVAEAGASITLYNPADDVILIDKTDALADDVGLWVEITCQFQPNSALFQPTVWINTATGLNLNALIFIDEFVIYEYEDVDEEEDPVVIEKIYHSKNPITLGKAATAGWELLTNFRVYDDVRVEMEAGTDVFTSKLKIDLVPDSDGSVIFQVREAFRGVLTAAPPDEGEDALQQLTDRIKKFKHYTGEISGVETEPAELVASSLYMAMLGGLNKLQFAEIGGQSKFFDTYLVANKKFLTWAPTTKEVDNNQEDYLTFFIYADTITIIKVQIKAYYDDATDETDLVHTQAVSFAQLWQIPAGTSNSGVKLINPAKTVIKYEISLLNQDDELISEVRTYIIDPIRLPYKKFFMFLNSLGSYEVLRFYGATENEITISKETLVKFLPYNYAAQDGEKAVNYSEVQKASGHSSGYFKTLSAEWLEYMEDFLLSTRVFDVTDGVRKPIVVEPGTFPMGADKNFERFIRFKAINSYQDEVYTPATI